MLAFYVFLFFATSTYGSQDKRRTRLRSHSQETYDRSPKVFKKEISYFADKFFQQSPEEGLQFFPRRRFKQNSPQETHLQFSHAYSYPPIEEDINNLSCRQKKEEEGKHIEPLPCSNFDAHFLHIPWETLAKKGYVPKNACYDEQTGTVFHFRALIGAGEGTLTYVVDVCELSHNHFFFLRNCAEIRQKTNLSAKNTVRI